MSDHPVDLTTTFLAAAGVPSQQPPQPPKPQLRSVTLAAWFGDGPRVYLKPHDQRPYTRDEHGNEVCLHGLPE